MKPILRQITSTPEYSFIIRKDIGEHMLNNWHYHPEVELLFIKRSSGTWLIGDHIGHFQSGDLVLLGANLPHCFRHEYNNIFKRDDTAGETICIKFEPGIFGNQFLNMPETKEITALLSACNCGLKLTGKIKNNLSGKIIKMLDASPGKKLVYLLSILEEIAESRNYIQLSSKGFVQSPGDKYKEKLRLIFEYTFSHYNEKITLDEAAALVNMTRQSFCRYFKNKTKKTYIQFFDGSKNRTCLQIINGRRKNVSEISYQCGYNNISNFNQQFKLITRKKPLEYKRHYLKTESLN